MDVEAGLQEVGRTLAERMPPRARHPMRALDEKAMELSAQDAELRAALFRLVDVTPACRSLDDLARHLTSYLDGVEQRPQPLRAAMRMSESRAGRAALGAAAAAGVRHMAHRFIVGTTPEDAAGELRSMWRDGIAASLDLLGEATVTQDEADRYAERCTHALRVLAKTAGRLRPLLRLARELDAHLHVDMESVDALETTLELVFDLLSEDEFAAGPSTGVVLQAYLRDSPAHLDRLLEWSREGGRRPPPVVRLVKGPYWGHEGGGARQPGWAP